MNNEEEIIEYLESYIQFYTVLKAPEPQDAKMMAAVKGILKLYEDKKEEAIAIARANYILGQTDERSQWYKKINEKIEYIEKEMEKDEVDEFGIHSQGWLTLDWLVDNLKELIGKEE